MEKIVISTEEIAVAADPLQEPAPSEPALPSAVEQRVSDHVLKLYDIGFGLG